jgi:hypothetical protein
MRELSLHILDIVENSTRAGAKQVFITIAENAPQDTLTVEVADDGRGMSPDVKEKVLDPFYTTKTVRRVGLGLPMLAQAAERTGGRLTLESNEGKGTRVTASFGLSHIDRQPLGDMAGTMVSLIAGNTDVDFVYRHERGERLFVFDTREVRAQIDDVPINNAQVLHFVRELIEEGLKDLEAKA